MDKYVLKVSLQGFKVSLQRKRENTNECLVSLRSDKVMAFFRKHKLETRAYLRLEINLDGEEGKRAGKTLLNKEINCLARKLIK